MKRILFSFFILTTLVVLLLFGLTSCTTVITPNTGIVTITLDISEIGPIMGVDLERPIKNYYVYMDDVYQGTMTSSGALTLEDVPLGSHNFEASDYVLNGDSFNLCDDGDTQKEVKFPVNGYSYCYGSVIYKVKLGINYVTIPVSCYSSIIIE